MSIPVDGLYRSVGLEQCRKFGIGMRPAGPVTVLIVNQDDIRGLHSEVFDQSSALTRKVNLQTSRCLGIDGFIPPIDELFPVPKAHFGAKPMSLAASAPSDDR